MEDNVPTPELEQTEPKAILDGWMTRAELAKELGVCVDTLGRWQTMRIGPPCVRTGRRVFYRRASVIEWLKQKEIRENRISNL
ncbi:MULTISPECIES: helix-turn-helix domain-containing protein [unclassified Pseudovibrio]|uniref:helix-turn-helix transcriptional regulator n=1 Tax=unclassified Pseudovibrio TaxID=2627060 RepID=UPI0007AE75D9|nr:MULTISPECIES: helix-turn-helix domain-containing protein [unclassified Pseudovibrio]KZK95272.1 Helix-turn-helix domain protein [Pseudovibrio sp. W74]KZL07254.1 Helix-turn-helix domain protein [Pseudovibrio sp. Ad14]